MAHISLAQLQVAQGCTTLGCFCRGSTNLCVGAESDECVAALYVPQAHRLIPRARDLRCQTHEQGTIVPFDGQEIHCSVMPDLILKQGAVPIEA